MINEEKRKRIFDLCKNDLSRVYMINKFFRLVSFLSGSELILPFRLHKHQEDILYKSVESDKLIVRQSRQTGMTSAFTAKMACDLFFGNEGETFFIFSPKYENTMRIMNMLRTFLTQIPSWMYDLAGKTNVIDGNDKYIGLKNGAKVIRGDEKGLCFRGYNLPSRLFFDNAAYIPYMTQIIESALPLSQSNSQQIVLSSTPNWDKTGKDFKKLFFRSKGLFNSASVQWWNCDGEWTENLKWIDCDGDELDKYELATTTEDDRFKMGFYPTSDWYERMCRQMGNKKRMIHNEVDGLFKGEPYPEDNLE